MVNGCLRLFRNDMFPALKGVEVRERGGEGAWRRGSVVV